MEQAQRLYIVRHGQTTGHDIEIHGGGSNPPLSPEGRKQARNVGRTLGEAGVEVILHSPKVRNHQSAAEAAIGYQEVTGHEIQLIEDQRLDERKFGPVEDLRAGIDPRIDEGLMAARELLVPYWLSPLAERSSLPLPDMEPDQLHVDQWADLLRDEAIQDYDKVGLFTHWDKAALFGVYLAEPPEYDRQPRLYDLDKGGVLVFDRDHSKNKLVDSSGVKKVYSLQSL